MSADAVRHGSCACPPCAEREKGSNMQGTGWLSLRATLAVIGVGLMVATAPPAPAASKRDVTIRAAVMADSSGPDRAQNLVRAVERLNASLPDVAIHLELEEPPSKS